DPVRDAHEDLTTRGVGPLEIVDGDEERSTVSRKTDEYLCSALQKAGGSTRSGRVLTQHVRKRGCDESSDGSERAFRGDPKCFFACRPSGIEPTNRGEKRVENSSQGSVRSVAFSRVHLKRSASTSLSRSRRASADEACLAAAPGSPDENDATSAGASVVP